MPENRLVIVSTRPGLHRGRLVHPSVATYSAEQLTAAGVGHPELLEMLDEPALTVMFGFLLVPGMFTGEHGATLLAQPLVTDAGPLEMGLAHGVQPVAVVGEDGQVAGSIPVVGAGPLVPTPPALDDAMREAAATVEAAHELAAPTAAARGRRGR